MSTPSTSLFPADRTEIQTMALAIIEHIKGERRKLRAAALEKAMLPYTTGWIFKKTHQPTQEEAEVRVKQMECDPFHYCDWRNLWWGDKDRAAMLCRAASVGDEPTIYLSTDDADMLARYRTHIQLGDAALA